MSPVLRMKAPRTPTQVELNGMVASVAHLAYHLGAIRQIDAATRGPTAEDERAVSLASPHQG